MLKKNSHLAELQKIRTEVNSMAHVAVLGSLVKRSYDEDKRF